MTQTVVDTTPAPQFIIYDYLLIDSTFHLVTETGGRIIIGSRSVTDYNDQRSTYEMTASFIQIQTVDPITLTPVGQFRLNSTLSLPTPTFAERILTIASTDTTVPLPLGATVMVITPPANCTSVLLLKGAAGDTGFTLNTSNPSCISVPAGPANVLLNSNPSAIYMFTFM